MLIDTMQPEVTSRRVRKLLFASRGINLILFGVWMCVQAGLQIAQSAEPAWKSVTQLGMLFGYILLLLGLRWIHRARKQQDCHAAGSPCDSVRSEIKLFSMITIGVVTVLALYLLVPQIDEAEWLAPIALSLFLLLGGVYFVREAICLKLFELAILGLVFWVGSVFVLNVSDSSPTGAQIQSGVVATQLALGVLMLTLGTSLHRRWRLWREQVLSA